MIAPPVLLFVGHLCVIAKGNMIPDRIEIQIHSLNGHDRRYHQPLAVGKCRSVFSVLDHIGPGLHNFIPVLPKVCSSGDPFVEGDLKDQLLAFAFMRSKKMNCFQKGDLIHRDVLRTAGSFRLVPSPRLP